MIKWFFVPFFVSRGIVPYSICWSQRISQEPPVLPISHHWSLWIHGHIIPYVVPEATWVHRIDVTYLGAKSAGELLGFLWNTVNNGIITAKTIYQLVQDHSQYECMCIYNILVHVFCVSHHLIYTYIYIYIITYIHSALYHLSFVYMLLVVSCITLYWCLNTDSIWFLVISWANFFNHRNGEIGIFVSLNFCKSRVTRAEDWGLKPWKIPGEIFTTWEVMGTKMGKFWWHPMQNEKGGLWWDYGQMMKRKQWKNKRNIWEMGFKLDIKSEKMMGYHWKKCKELDRWKKKGGIMGN